MAPPTAIQRPRAPRRFRLRSLRLRRSGLWVLALVTAMLSLGPIVFIAIRSFVIDVPGGPDRVGLDAWREVFATPSLVDPMLNTLDVALVRVAVGVPIGVVVAWLLARSKLPGRGALELLFWIAFFLPTVSVTVGWILLLDPSQGLLNVALAALPGSPTLDIYSFGGIVAVGALNGTIPAMVILLTPTFRLMSADLEFSSRVAGAGRWRTLRKISIPLVAPTLIVATILAFVKSVESFEIEQLLGVPINFQVYSTMIYRLVRFDPPQLEVASALGLIVLVGMLPLVLLRARVRESATVGSREFTVTRVSLGKARWFAFAGVALLGLFSAVIPLVMLLLGSVMTLFGFFGIAEPFTLDHWGRVLTHPALLGALRNTILLGLGAGVGGGLLLAMLAYVIVRGRSRSARLIGFFSWIPWFMPGILLSMGLLWAFLANPVLRPLFGTFVGLVVAMIIREMPFAVQLLRGAFSQLDAELEEASRISGVSWLGTFTRIVIPIAAPVVATVAVLVGLAAVKDVSTILLLSTQQSRPLSLLVLQFSTFGEVEAAAVTGLLQSVIVLVGALVGRTLSERYTPH